jgi:6-phosphofructokinase 1
LIVEFSGNRQLFEALKQRFGSPGKWEMLFQRDDRLVVGLAENISERRLVGNPRLKLQGQEETSCVPYGATVPAVHDWDVLEVFREQGMVELVPRFYLAGERNAYFFDPRKVTVGILIAGGPAAGLNMVIDSIVKRHFALATQMLGSGEQHEVRVYGYHGGYKGFGENAKETKVWLAPSRTTLRQAKRYPEVSKVWFSDDWATDPGVRLTTARDKPLQEPRARRDLALRHAGVVHGEELDILYVVGGEGTLSWAHAICQAVASKPETRRVVVVGGPKTMDNDVNFTDATFGFRTAVDNAAQFIRTIHTAAESMNRLGIIELFGAASGFVALHAGYVSGVADYVMIPEPPHPDEDEVLDYLAERKRRKGHAVVVVAEGALHSFRQGNVQEKEEAFNSFVRKCRDRFGAVADVRARYLMRDTAPTTFDLDLCKWSGKLMVDTALAGFTGCTVNLWQGDFVLVPFETATARLKQVVPWSYYLQTLRDRERLALLENVRVDQESEYEACKGS